MDDQKKLSLLQLSGKINKGGWPQFQCTNCGNYSQKLTNLNFSESQDSLAEHKEEWWDPELIHGSFAAISACQVCKDKAYILGDYDMEGYVDDEDIPPHLEYSEVFRIKFMNPSVQILKLPSKCPAEVKAYVNSAAQVIFVSPDLASNRIRASIDVLLTEQKIPRFKVEKGKQVKLSTHKRIMLFAAKNPEVAGLLEAVKWIGNEGTHNSSLSMSDILEGLEIYSLSLDLLYGTGTAAVRKKAATINKNKGFKKSPLPF